MTSRILSLAASATLAGAALFAAPAFAEVQRDLQLDVQYDAAALDTASGAEKVLNSLQEQAIDACRYTRPVAGAPHLCGQHPSVDPDPGGAQIGTPLNKKR